MEDHNRIASQNARDAAFAYLDHRNFDDKRSDGSTIPLPRAAISNECPRDVPGCDPDFPFTFSSVYTLEPAHFGLLERIVRRPLSEFRAFRVWSAACATGEEP